ncbi:OmpA family protein [Halioxenophilus aromaticivorans]|uniref:OmpA family protein n=1 Tax=Halioxenophilus aromaticivorans TaxID=1306992 RepID=A0AAV3TYW9_9ALTE
MNMQEFEEDSLQSPVWPVFGDLMSGLVGVFVILLVWVLGFQLQLAQTLKEETEKRQTEQTRRVQLEQALADPLASGRITFEDGRIGISGAVLFDINSSELQPEGEALLRSLITPLNLYLSEQDQLLMVSGFTDSRPIQAGNLHFADNWQLSSERALTVTRLMIEAGLPANRIFAAAFGEQQPVASNEKAEGRAQNRRVEISPVPRISSEKTPDAETQTTSDTQVDFPAPSADPSTDLGTDPSTDASNGDSEAAINNTEAE